MKKKSKHKTLYIRRIRNKSNNKRVIRFYEEFDGLFDYFFYLKRNKLKKKSFINFLKRFHSSGLHKMQNYTKLFGFKKNYRLGIFISKSFFEEDLKKKFKIKKKSKKKNANKYRNTKILKLIFKKRFNRKVNKSEKKERTRKILEKKVLCLHVSYRHLLGLPVRGQRTKTNARTRKDFKIV